MAALRPPSATRPAACSPAGPAPITTTSYESVTGWPLLYFASLVIAPLLRSLSSHECVTALQGIGVYGPRPPLHGADPARTAESRPAPSLRRPGRLEGRVQGEAAVDKDCLPGDVRRFIGAQERGHRGHLLGAAGPPHRDVAFHHAPLDRVVNPRPVDGRDGRAGADAVDPYSPCGVLQRQRPGEILHAALRHRVAEESWLRDHLVHAGHVDDHAG